MPQTKAGDPMVIVIKTSQENPTSHTLTTSSKHNEHFSVYIKLICAGELGPKQNQIGTPQNKPSGHQSGVC